MARVVEIHDPARSGPDVYFRLTEPQLRSRAQPERGLFIAEGVKVIRCALDAGYEPVSFLAERRHIEGKARELLERAGDVPVYTGAPELLSTLTGYALTRGVLCALRRRPLPPAETVCAGARRLAVLEDVTDSTNVGAVFRAAAALGVDGVLLTPRCCDALCRRSVRVSMGTVFQLPWTRLDGDTAPWPQGGLALLRSLGFQTAALALDHRAVALDDPRLAEAERLALILGTEGDGLSAQTVAESDFTVRIPMARGVDSLNVAAAAAVAFWQLRVR